MKWAKEETKKETEKYNAASGPVTVTFSQGAYIPKNEERSFNVGYLFLQQICKELRLDNICRKIRSHHKFTYDFKAILTDLTDHLHRIFGFHTDFEFISNSSMRNIIKNAKIQQNESTKN